jgi:hypothetical protein
MRTSLYVDDAVMFLIPIAADMENLQVLLHQFGVSTRLCTNVHKSEIYLIWCDNINVTDILGDFQVRMSQFPCKYLGLPLQIGWVRREDEQLLIDKVAGKLPKWKGRLLNKSGRLTMVNSMLSTVVLYHMTVFPLSKWTIKRIDRIRRNFLWLGAEAARGGHSHVNWQRV